MKKTEKIFGLSETEYEIMEFMWQSDHKLTYKEILDYFNTEKNKNWKKQTLSTFLTILKYAGHITAEGSGRRYLYSPVKTREQQGAAAITAIVVAFQSAAIGLAVGIAMHLILGVLVLEEHEHVEPAEES